ncbi:MAG: hypothetical protein U0T81_12295 [Saprospiraceae bacterium]
MHRTALLAVENDNLTGSLRIRILPCNSDVAAVYFGLLWSRGLGNERIFDGAHIYPAIDQPDIALEIIWTEQFVEAGYLLLNSSGVIRNYTARDDDL